MNEEWARARARRPSRIWFNAAMLHPVPNSMISVPTNQPELSGGGIRGQDQQPSTLQPEHTFKGQTWRKKNSEVLHIFPKNIEAAFDQLPNQLIFFC